MADVRALLRNELAARRGTDATNNSTTRVSKKRKLDTEHIDLRKRPRPTEIPEKHATEENDTSAEEVIADATPPEETTQAVSDIKVSQPPTSLSEQEPIETQQAQIIDEDEWAAFEREVAAPSRLHPPATATLSAEATISAAPLSAAELEARERAERESGAKEPVDEGLGDREDAVRHLEEEFEEMEELEERVRRLKEKREEIRRRKEEGVMNTENGTLSMETEVTTTIPQEESDIDSGEEDEDDWDNWRFRRHK
ncbi:hypothetical protein VTO42DRAFT_8146 [Malbranchea cinnamomea]